MARKTAARVLRQLLPMTVVSLSTALALSGIVWHLEKNSAVERFQELAEQRIIAIRANIAIAQDSVDLLVGHFAASPQGATSRAGFARMVERTVSNHRFVQGFSWDPKLRPDQVAAYEAAAVADGLQGFRITERDGEGKPVPVAPREYYIPIYYMEPQAGNAKALGFDLASHPVRRQALEIGRDQGMPQATGRITLVQESGNQYGVLVLAPVFGPFGPRTVEQNRQALTGYVSGVFRIGDLVERSGGESLDQAIPLVDIQLSDLSAASSEQRLYPKDAKEAVPGAEPFQVTESFDMAGRQWQLSARPSAAYLAANKPVAAVAVLGVSLVATLFYLSYLRARIFQAETAQAQATAMDTARRRLGEAQRIARLASLELLPDGQGFVAGEGVAAMLGLPEETQRGPISMLLDRVVDEDRVRLGAALESALQDTTDLEFRVSTPEGLRTLHALTGSTLTEGHALITLQDVSLRKAAEEERAAMISRIAESDRFEALGTLAGGIAHEINTPAQYVGDNLRFLKEGAEPLLALARQARQEAESSSPDWSEVAESARSLDLDFLAEELPAAADQALDGTSRIAKIVQAIKEFSYPSAKTAQPFDLNHTIDVVATVTRNQWKYLAEMDLDMDPALPKITGIEGEISQVLVNLFVNAAHAIAETGKIPGRIAVTTRAVGDAVQLDVADSGAGIAPENLKQVFEMFFTTKEPGKGTGQGLAICRAIIHRHGGQITVDSQPGKGARFTIRLPRVAPDSVCRPAQPKEA